MDETTKKCIKEQIASIVTLENIQKYILGTRKSGQPRALYDILSDFGKKKKSKSKKIKPSLYLNINRKKKKKKGWKF